MFDKLNPNSSETINSISDEKISGQIPIDDIDILEDILKDGEEAEVSIISEQKDSRVEENIGLQFPALEEKEIKKIQKCEKKTSENHLEISRSKDFDSPSSPKLFSKNEEKILKRLEDNRAFKEKGSLKNKKGNESNVEKSRSHLYISNLDNSFTKEELHKIFFEEFERNHRFKINNIDIKQDRSSFLVKLSFEDIQNALDVLYKKDDFILPFKDKNKCIEPSETLEKYIIERGLIEKLKANDKSLKTSPESQLAIKHDSNINSILQRNEHKSCLFTNDKRVSFDKEKEFSIKKHSFDGNTKPIYDNSQKNKRSRTRSRSRKNSSSDGRSHSGKRNVTINKKYKHSSKKDYSPLRENFLHKDIERKDNVYEKKDYINNKSQENKSNTVEKKEINFLRKDYNFDLRHNKHEKKENSFKGFNHSFSDNIRKPSNEITHNLTNFSQPIVSIDDEMHFRCCYFLGVPLNVQGNHIYQELLKRRIDYPDKFDIIKKNDNSQEYTYYSLVFREKRFVDTLLEEGFEILNNPVLVLPSLPDKSLEEMVLFHQVFVYSLDNNLGSIYLIEELTNLYRFFTRFGKIVDFFLENFPMYFVITYVKHSSVLNLIKMDSIVYSSPSNFQYRLKAKKVDFKLQVRNTVDFNKTAYENYMPLNVKQS